MGVGGVDEAAGAGGVRVADGGAVTDDGEAAGCDDGFGAAEEADERDCTTLFGGLLGGVRINFFAGLTARPLLVVAGAIVAAEEMEVEVWERGDRGEKFVERNIRTSCF